MLPEKHKSTGRDANTNLQHSGHQPKVQRKNSKVRGILTCIIPAASPEIDSKVENKENHSRLGWLTAGIASSAERLRWARSSPQSSLQRLTLLQLPGSSLENPQLTMLAFILQLRA